MFIKVSNVKLPYTHTKEQLIQKTAQVIGIQKGAIQSIEIIKKSCDARKSNQIMFVYNLVAKTDKKYTLKKSNQNVQLYEKKTYQIPEIKNIDKAKDIEKKVYVIGAGPAGLFSGLLLAKAGYRPIIIEQGKDVDSRKEDIESFFKGEELQSMSNIQFGEGGAGTFSDGKLNTGVKDKFLRKDYILETFIAAGADPSILYMNKPHIGTDYLIKVVKNMRLEIIKLGGEVRFSTKFVSYESKKSKDGKEEISAIHLQNLQSENSQKEIYVEDTKRIILATGHSARETFKMLYEKNVPLEAKAFAMGLRAIHPQEIINKNQYGKAYRDSKLPVADYKLTYKSSTGRGVYSFCMCPGGYVVNASSHEKSVVCNGMSNFKRDAKYANSAVIVTVKPEDYENSHPLAGIKYQEKWEEKAFCLGKKSYTLPIQKYKDFKREIYKETVDTEKKQSGEGNLAERTVEAIRPEDAIKGAYTYANLTKVLPSVVSKSIVEAFEKDFKNKIAGYNEDEVLLVGIETRTSSPVKIRRNENFMSDIIGLYPCGEGAGYAGGIMSAAMDGMKVAEAILKEGFTFNGMNAN